MIGRLKFRTKEARRKHHLKKVFRILFFLASIGLVGGVGVFLLHQPFLRINNFSVHTNGVLPEKEISLYLEQELTGNFFTIIPKNSIFLAHDSILEKKIYKLFPRIKNVAFQRADIYTLHIDIIERTPEALWCGDVVPTIAYENTSTIDPTHEEVWGTCYLLDHTGFIYAKSPLYSGNVFPRYYGQLNAPTPIGVQFLQEDEFSTLQTIHASNFNDNLPRAILLVDEYDVEIYLSNGLRILAPRSESVETITSRITAILTSDTINYEKEVEYVDFRFGKKVFIKYRKDIMEEATTPML